MGSKFKLRENLKALSQKLPHDGVSSDAFAALWQEQYKAQLLPAAFECSSIVDLVQSYGSTHLRIEERRGTRGAVSWILAKPQAGAKPGPQVQQPTIQTQTPRVVKPNVDSGAALIRTRLHEGGIQVTHARVWHELTELGYTDHHAVQSSKELQAIRFLGSQLDIIITSFIASR